MRHRRRFVESEILTFSTCVCAGTRGMVASTQPLATEAGLSVQLNEAVPRQRSMNSALAELLR